LTVSLATNYYRSLWNEGKMRAKSLVSLLSLKTKSLSLHPAFLLVSLKFHKGGET
jgi:hypothetical protein